MKRPKRRGPRILPWETPDAAGLYLVGRPLLSLTDCLLFISQEYIHLMGASPMPSLRSLSSRRLCGLIEVVWDDHCYLPIFYRSPLTLFVAKWTQQIMLSSILDTSDSKAIGRVSQGHIGTSVLSSGLIREYFYEYWIMRRVAMLNIFTDMPSSP